MRVLWFTNTPSRYAVNGGYNGGGWISSLEEEITKRDDIDLGIAFFMNGQPKKVERKNVTYYPIEALYGTSYKSKIKRHLLSQPEKESLYVKQFLNIINDYKPDVIEVFGSESSFGEVAQYTKIPVVLHIQGILTPYLNAYFPPFISKHNYIWQDINPLHVYHRSKDLTYFKINAKREINIIQHVHYFIGRTSWDKRVTLLYNHSAKYFYGSEILRDVFYESSERILSKKIIIVSTLSCPLYKGYETVLKTAFLLKKLTALDFEWQIYGNIDPQFVEKRLNIRHDDVNVKFMGVASADELKKRLCSATVYVHLSYIDNSPNSVCEAQILGLPVVATNVGGVPSLIKDGETGFLVPANDPYQTAYIINKLANDRDLNLRIGNNAREIALIRHNKRDIVNSLVNTYKQIINDIQNNY